jgi:hypothetical protein
MFPTGDKMTPAVAKKKWAPRPTDEKSRRLGNFMRERRIRMSEGKPYNGHKPADTEAFLIDHDAQISNGVWRTMESGVSRKYRPSTYAEVERVLGVPDGTAQGVLDGTITHDQAVNVQIKTATEKWPSEKVSLKIDAMHQVNEILKTLDDDSTAWVIEQIATLYGYDISYMDE